MTLNDNDKGEVNANAYFNVIDNRILKQVNGWGTDKWGVKVSWESSIPHLKNVIYPI